MPATKSITLFSVQLRKTSVSLAHAKADQRGARKRATPAYAGGIRASSFKTGGIMKISNLIKCLIILLFIFYDMPVSSALGDKASDSDHAAIFKIMELRAQKIEARLDGIDDATRLKTEELNRRLDILNHAHENAVKDREQFLRRDVYETKMKDIDVFKADISERVTSIESSKITWLAALGIIFIIMQVFLNIYYQKKKVPK